MSASPFDWEEFLELAEELVARRGDPGAGRSAVSRAYYAAFNTASAYVASHGGRLTFTGEDHVRVWGWFIAPEAGGRLRWIGSAGQRLRRVRRQADYDPIPTSNFGTDAEAWVTVARRIVDELNTVE